jgi:hypothetical protein
MVVLLGLRFSKEKDIVFGRPMEAGSEAERHEERREREEERAWNLLLKPRALRYLTKIQAST